MAGKSENFRMNLLSIRSFNRHIAGDQRARNLREATAAPSAVPIRLRNSLWGRHGTSNFPATTRRIFRNKGLAMRTAKTPDFGRGQCSILAMSPAANTRGNPAT